LLIARIDIMTQTIAMVASDILKNARDYAEKTAADAVPYISSSLENDSLLCR